MVNFDRLPAWILASHYAKEIAHGQSTDKQTEAVLHSSGTHSRNRHHRGYKDCEVHWSKIGNRRVRTILIPATKEQYYEFMRPLWREDKRQQRHGADEISADKAQDDYELEVPDDFNLEEEVVKEELLAALRHELATLQDIDRTILMMIADGASEAATGKAVSLSQKAVNMRKHKLYAILKEHLEDFR